MTAAPAGADPHDHDLRLVATHLEDGTSVQEFRCAECGAVWFS